jgi:DICT domain-containing protein
LVKILIFDERKAEVGDLQAIISRFQQRPILKKKRRRYRFLYQAKPKVILMMVADHKTTTTEYRKF